MSSLELRLAKKDAELLQFHLQTLLVRQTWTPESYESYEYLALRKINEERYFITKRNFETEPIHVSFNPEVDEFYTMMNTLSCTPTHDKYLFTPKPTKNKKTTPEKKSPLATEETNKSLSNDKIHTPKTATSKIETSNKKKTTSEKTTSEKANKKSASATSKIESSNKNKYQQRQLNRKINAKKKQDRKVFAEAAKISFEKIATQALILAIEMADKIRAKTNKKKALHLGTILKEIDASSRLFFTAFLNDDDLILEKKENMKVLKPKKNARKQVVEKQEEKEDKEQEKHEENKQHECVICLCSISNIACVPCGHLIMCSKCFEDENNSLKECPLCRKEISLMVKIFI
jgi:hypothetical protein